MKKASLVIIALMFDITVQARQQTLEYKSMGITITVPSGFQYQESEEALVMASISMPNTLFILMMHEYTSVDELKAAADEPYTENNGTRLTRSGDIDQIGSDVIAAPFSGKAGGYPAEAYMLGRLNPYGSGVSVIGLSVNQSTPMEKLKETVMTINAGLFLREKETPSVVEEWIEKLSNTRLEYRSSYSSPSYTGGVSGYSGSNETYDICQSGFFTYYGSSGTSLSSENLSVVGNSNSSRQGSGTWEIYADENGNPRLKLSHYDGKVEDYLLYYEKGYLYLDEYKHTIGRGAEYGPSCY